MNNIPANVKILRAALSAFNARARVCTGCRKGAIHVDMKFGSNRAQRVAAFEALANLGAIISWGSAPKAICDVFGSDPHTFDSVSVLAFMGAA